MPKGERSAMGNISVKIIGRRTVVARGNYFLQGFASLKEQVSIRKSHNCGMIVALDSFKPLYLRNNV